MALARRGPFANVKVNGQPVFQNVLAAQTPTGAGTCDGTNSGTDCHCGHYAVSSSSDTAMANAKGFLYVEALDREIDFDAAEWNAVDITQIRRP